MITRAKWREQSRRKQERVLEESRAILCDSGSLLLVNDGIVQVARGQLHLSKEHNVTSPHGSWTHVKHTHSTTQHHTAQYKHTHTHTTTYMRKRRRPGPHLPKHDAQRIDVCFFRVLMALEHLGGHPEGRAQEGGVEAQGGSAKREGE